MINIVLNTNFNNTDFLVNANTLTAVKEFYDVTSVFINCKALFFYNNSRERESIETAFIGDTYQLKLNRGAGEGRSFIDFYTEIKEHPWFVKYMSDQIKKYYRELDSDGMLIIIDNAPLALEALLKTTDNPDIKISLLPDFNPDNTTLMFKQSLNI